MAPIYHSSTAVSRMEQTSTKEAVLRFPIAVLVAMVVTLILVIPAQTSAGATATTDMLNNVCRVQCDGMPVRSLSNHSGDSYGRAGLSHITVAGAVHHGLKEVEVWMQTFAPGSGTPIHRHACEEVFVVLRGNGTLFLAEGGDGTSESGEGGGPGHVREHLFHQNDTFTVPVNAVHQVSNTAPTGDLQLLVVISRPPIHVFTYENWTVDHKHAKLVFPYPWDAKCLT